MEAPTCFDLIGIHEVRLFLFEIEIVLEVVKIEYSEVANLASDDADASDVFATPPIAEGTIRDMLTLIAFPRDG